MLCYALGVQIIRAQNQNDLILCVCCVLNQLRSKHLKGRNKLNENTIESNVKRTMNTLEMGAAFCCDN